GAPRGLILLKTGGGDVCRGTFWPMRENDHHRSAGWPFQRCVSCSGRISGFCAASSAGSSRLSRWFSSPTSRLAEHAHAPQVSPVLCLAVRSCLDPRHIVLGDVNLLELFPRGDCLCARRTPIRFKEVGDEIDVATVRDSLESPHPVQDNVLSDEITVRRVIAARDLFFSPAVQAIPDPGLFANIGRHHPGLFDDEILRFTVA